VNVSLVTIFEGGDAMADLGQCKILAVDDSKENLDILTRTLGKDYLLATAMDGPQALAYAAGHSLDLVLLDVVMPQMDGFEVCRRLKADPVTTNIPIIFITSMDDPRDKTKGFDAGAVDYITKPFDITEVKARVKTHLSLRVAQEALKIQNIVLEVKVRERTKEMRKVQQELFERLGRVAEVRDPTVPGHLRRISAYTRLIAKAAGLTDEVVEDLSLASMAHDLGKIGIPAAILFKPQKLTSDEFAAVKTHAALGGQLLAGSRSKLIQLAETIAVSHHEKWDGSGYPKGLAGEAIPLPGRIVGLCDVLDALVMDRPYKKAWSLDQALKEIRAGSGQHFDPALIQVLPPAQAIAEAMAAGR